MRGWNPHSMAFSSPMRSAQKAKHPGRVDVCAGGGGEGI
jgi:hypothetical protein